MKDIPFITFNGRDPFGTFVVFLFAGVNNTKKYEQR